MLHIFFLSSVCDFLYKYRDLNLTYNLRHFTAISHTVRVTFSHLSLSLFITAQIISKLCMLSISPDTAIAAHIILFCMHNSDYSLCVVFCSFIYIFLSYCVSSISYIWLLKIFYNNKT